jgi:hypothetical protein
MSVRVFLSTVSDEFRAYRDQLRADLTRHNVEVKVQEDFKDLGGDTLDVYAAHCDAEALAGMAEEEVELHTAAESSACRRVATKIAIECNKIAHGNAVRGFF